jgi:hypothetical protein
MFERILAAQGLGAVSKRTLGAPFFRPCRARTNTAKIAAKATKVAKPRPAFDGRAVLTSVGAGRSSAQCQQQDIVFR